MSEEYEKKGDKEIVNTVKAFKALNDAPKEEMPHIMANILMQEYGLHQSVTSARLDWYNLANERKETYLRMIGKKFLKDGKVNQDLLKEVYGSNDSVKKIALKLYGQRRER